ncbi:MAG: competence/damage-inducible protein A, partial [Sphingobacteriales bacterium]
MANVKVSIITIGDELLIGQTIDTNSAWMAQQLNGYGFDVVRRVAVGDSGGEIRYALDEEQKRSEIVLITGGLGPTADDITKPFLCDYFGSKLVVNKEVKDHVLHIFSRRNMPVLERNLRQAEVPDNCEVLFNTNGTAPGMLFRKDDRIIISMPGVPNEMKGIMEDHVIPFLRQNFRRESIC